MIVLSTIILTLLLSNTIRKYKVETSRFDITLRTVEMLMYSSMLVIGTLLEMQLYK